jgi:hypothetical protein
MPHQTMKPDSAGIPLAQGQQRAVIKQAGDHAAVTLLAIISRTLMPESSD